MLTLSSMEAQEMLHNLGGLIRSEAISLECARHEGGSNPDIADGNVKFHRERLAKLRTHRAELEDLLATQPPRVY